MTYKSSINNMVTPIEKKEPKIADRIQEKLNFIKSGYEAKANDIIKRRDHTPITGKKIMQAVTTSNTTSPAAIITSKRDPVINVRKQRQSFLQRKQTTNITSQQAKNVLSRSRQKQSSTSTPYSTNQQRISQSTQQRSTQQRSTQQRSTQQRSTQQRVSQQQRTTPSRSNQLPSNPSKQSSIPTKIVHNNWIINNQVLKETSLNEAQMMKSSVKQLGSKSVIIVKPNQFNQQQSVNQRSDSRQSLRKVSTSQAKMADKQNRASLNKENTAFVSTNQKNSKFFRVDKNDSSSTTSIGMVKMRSSSTKPIRKDDLANSSIMKNSSYSGKGKWKC